MKKIKAAALFIVALLVLSQAALAAEKTDAKPKYKKVTGNVVSLTKTVIVVKSKAKGDVTLAVTDKTDIVDGKAAKAGDKVAVNYRMDQSGKTATRIEVLSPVAKAPQARPVTKAAAAPAAKAAP
jgi:di/tripeptidase